MTTDIFIRSYSKDFEWLRYCLWSIAKFGSGFRQTVITVPAEDAKDLKHLTLEKVIPVKQNCEGYMHQQVSKLMADQYCEGADNILYVDSDCYFKEAFRPEDYFRDGKIVLLKTAYSTLGATVPWKPITEKAMKFECEFEYMRRVPVMFYADTIRECRNYLTRTQGIQFDDYIAQQPSHGFSEFNALGAYADKFCHGSYQWIDTDKDELPTLKGIQKWSWSGVTPEIREEIEKVLT